MGLTKSTIELLPQFLLRRQVFCVGTINAEIQEQITQSILGLNLISQEKITLIIDTSGGGVDTGRWIADAVRCSEAPVTGLVVGCANSIAFWILQNCQRRVCWPHAKMMAHGSEPGGYRCDQPDFIEKMHKIVQLHREGLDFISRRTHQPIEKWREWSLTEHSFTAQEALELGIIDEIVKPQPIPGLDEVLQSVTI